MSDGDGCTCFASHQGECACDADWTPREVIELRSKVAELQEDIENLHTVMMAGAVEITEHWDEHCDAEGYGPANLVRRLEEGFPERYGYDAKTIVCMDKQITELQLDNQRLREALVFYAEGGADFHATSGRRAQQALSTPAPSLKEHDEKKL